jgi:hypothetical protein
VNSEGREWRLIPGSKYEIAEDGMLRHVVSGVTRYAPICTNGYRRSTMKINGKRRSVYTHALVAEAFIGPRPEGLSVNHKDGVKTNNRSSNLEYVTQRENLLHAWRTGLVRRVRKVRKPRGSKYTERTLRVLAFVREHPDMWPRHVARALHTLNVTARFVAMTVYRYSHKNLDINNELEALAAVQRWKEAA